MQVFIKSFNVPKIEVKSSGIELEVRDTEKNEHKFLGDCFVTMTGLVWCKGKTEKDNGVKITWNKLMTICENTDTLKAALKAAKDVTKV